jgi:glycosyltransferase involved in cell wall biosynthesis
VIRHEANRGKGAALATGFRAALEGGLDAAIVVDADGQHDPAEVPRFLRCAARTDADLVVGTRMRRRRGMPFVRWATNAMMSNLLSILSGVRLSDTQCGMKLLSRRALERILGPARAAERFDIESEMILVLARGGFRIREVPISTIYIPGRKSRIRPLPDTLRFLWLVLRHVSGVARRGR